MIGARPDTNDLVSAYAGPEMHSLFIRGANNDFGIVKNGSLVKRGYGRYIA